MRASRSNCHCVETGHHGQSGQQTDQPTTSAPVSTMFNIKQVYDGCNDHNANGKITELLNGINSSPCMPDTQVWDLIFNIRKPECRHVAAQIVNVWNNLRQIPTDHQGQYNYACIYHLAEEIKNAMHSSVNTCQCWKKNIVTTDTTVPTTTTQTTPVPTTVAQTIAASCDPVKTLTGVAHNTVVGQTSKCQDGIHSPAIYFVQSACNLAYRLTDLSPGQKMKDACQNLPHYTGVGRFVGKLLETSQTTSDAGIFIGCGTDHFKIVTENCTTNLHVEHILFTDPKADSYYVINHP
ncbi:unnamed protein product [Mytilus coruscus]|uniref:Uncharacterized protein n=1 Tax=Mytilus coruscus TaxID=42192 RepID=A0A6J8C869_MYTCO|nr:unnamed protein product [Mytilus coruscus]